MEKNVDRKTCGNNCVFAKKPILIVTLLSAM